MKILSGEIEKFIKETCRMQLKCLTWELATEIVGQKQNI